MKVFAVAIMGVALIGSSQVAAKDVEAPLKLTASGEGRVKCTFTDARGNITKRDLKADRGGQAEYSSARFDHGTCEYKAASKEQLTITVEGDGWACPFNAASGVACAQTFANGAKGAFRLVQRAG